VQTSPIIEIYFIKVLLKIPYAIGLLSDFKYIRSIGFNLRPTRVYSDNRIQAFDEIYIKIKKISSSTVWATSINYGDEVVGRSRELGKYFILSAMKTSEWKMGRMPDFEYRLLAEFLIDKHDLNVIFVGDENEHLKLEAIISGSPFSDRMFNRAGKTTIEELSLLIKGAEFLIGNDNGISHLAAYLESKVLVLFMFSSPTVYTWSNRQNYRYIFNPIKKCMPCVGIPSAPKDNYPVRCRNNLACNSSITHKDVLIELRRVGWIADWTI
jgi:ADP-heptose:LPS heptosyltransferase